MALPVSSALLPAYLSLERGAGREDEDERATDHHREL
jgi:hypothetical protein